MPTFFDDGTDYSNYYYKNYRGEGDKQRDTGKKYYVSVRSHGNESIMLKALEPDEIDNEPYLPVHTVEYTSHETPPKSQHIRKKMNPWRVKSVALVIITIVICFMSTVLISDAMSGGYMLDELQATLTGRVNIDSKYYAIEVINFTDMTSAKHHSDQIRKIGGAGYVVHDTLYRVIAEIFNDKADADKVCAKLNTSGTMARVYEMDIDAADYKLLPSAVRNVTKKVMAYAADTYKSLHAISVKLAANEIDKNRAVTEIKSTRATLSATLIDYEASVDNKIDDKYVYKIRMQLGAILAAVDNLCASTDDNVGLLSNIRYTNVMLVNTHRALCRDIQNEDNSEGKK